MQRKHLFVISIIILTILNITTIYGLSHASGFAVYTQSASALAQGNAVTAHQDEPSAVFFNPSLIGKLPGTQFQIGSTFIHFSRDFESNTGGENKSASADFFPSALFVTHHLTDNITFGLGIFSPFGLGTDWGQIWEGRYISTNSELETININPVVNLRITEKLSVAFGIDYIDLDATLEKNLYLSPLPDGYQTFSGKGDGWGYNLAASFELTDKTTLGVHYRSDVQIDLNGEATFVLPKGTPSSIVTALRNSSARSSITLPRQAQLGLAYQFTDKLITEIGVRWEDWSSFKSLVINLDTGLTNETERNWKDVYAFNIGSKFSIIENFSLMGGYIFDTNPAPDSTFDPAIPTANAHIFAFGCEYLLNTWKIALAYGFQHFKPRDKNNSIGLNSGKTANGNYQSDGHMLALSLVYRF